MDVLTSKTCWAWNNEIKKKASDIKLVSLYSTISLCIIFHSIATNWFTNTWPLYGIIDKENTIHSETVMRPCVTLLVSLMTPVWQAIVTKVARISVSDPWSTTRLVPDDPEFGLPIGNLTTPVGREAVLSCTVDHLGKYKVSDTIPLTPLMPVLHVDSWLITNFSSMYIYRNKFITMELSLVKVRWPRNCKAVLWMLHRYIMFS